MADLTHLFRVGQRVYCNLDHVMYVGVVKEVYTDHIIVDIPEVSNHCRFEEGFTMNCVYPEYNFLRKETK